MKNKFQYMHMLFRSIALHSPDMETVELLINLDKYVPYAVLVGYIRENYKNILPASQW